MIKYSMKVAKSGRKMYFKNSKPCAEKNVPASILNQLEDGVSIEVSSDTTSTAPAQPGGTPMSAVQPDLTVDDQQPEQAQSEEPNVCVFCGEPATRQRYINQQTIRLCDADYDGHTTGEIVEQVNKVKAADKSKKEATEG